MTCLIFHAFEYFHFCSLVDLGDNFLTYLKSVKMYPSMQHKILAKGYSETEDFQTYLFSFIFYLLRRLF